MVVWAPWFRPGDAVSPNVNASPGATSVIVVACTVRAVAVLVSVRIAVTEPPRGSGDCAWPWGSTMTSATTLPSGSWNTTLAVGSTVPSLVLVSTVTVTGVWLASTEPPASPPGPASLPPGDVTLPQP